MLWAVIAFIIFSIGKKYLPYLSGKDVIEGVAARVEHRDVASVIIGTSEIKARVYEDYKSPAMSTVKRMLVKVGQKVEADTVLAELESQDARTRYETAIKDMAKAKTTLKDSQEKYSAAVMLYKKDLTSQEQVLEARKNLLQYKNETYTDTVKKLEQATKDYHALRILANFSGYVTEIAKQEGDLAPKDETIITVTKLEEFYARFFVSKIFRDRLKEGLPVEFFSIYDSNNNNRVGSGTISLISQFISQKGIQIEINFNPINPTEKEKYLNQNLRVIIKIEEHKNVAAIPVSSIYVDEKGYFVYVIKNSVTEKRYITIGLIGEQYVEVKTGLMIDDQFVKDPDDFVRPGLLFKKKSK